jgi:hypothetical protein
MSELMSEQLPAERFAAATNYAPWLGIGFLLSTLFFGIVSNGWLLFGLILLSFIPCLALYFSARGFYTIEDGILKHGYLRGKSTVEVIGKLNLSEIENIKFAGRAMELTDKNGGTYPFLVRNSQTLLEAILKTNPDIKVI